VTIWDWHSAIRETARARIAATKAPALLPVTAYLSVPDGRRWPPCAHAHLPNVDLLTWNLDSPAAPSVRISKQRFFRSHRGPTANWPALPPGACVSCSPWSTLSEVPFRADTGGLRNRAAHRFCPTQPDCRHLASASNGIAHDRVRDVNADTELDGEQPRAISNIAFQRETAPRLACRLIKASEG